MAPKRKAKQPAEEPPAKQMASVLKKHGVSQRSFTKVAEAISHPLADLPQDCQQMLLAGLAHSLCVPADERHAVQTHVVSMVEEVTSRILGVLQLGVDRENEKVAGAEAAKEALDQKVQDAHVALENSQAATADQEQRLKVASEEVCSAKTALGLRLKEQKAGDEGINLARAEKEKFGTMKAESFEKLKLGGVPAKEMKQLMKKLEPIIKQISVDQSLHTAAPEVLQKQPEERGSFDQIVIDQLETSFAEKLAEIDRKLAEAEPASAERASEVQKAEDAKAAAEAKQKEVSVAVCTAKEAQKEATSAVAAAKKAVSDYMAEYKSATETRDAKKEELDAFVDGPLATFQELKERISAKKKRELAKEAAEEAAAKAAATTAEEPAAQAV